MARKKAKDSASPDGGDDRGRGSIGKQVNVRIPSDLLADLEFIAADHGLDISSVIRMILTQNREGYIRRINERKQQGGS